MRGALLSQGAPPPTARRYSVGAAAALAIAAGGCAGGEVRPCSVGADCASGVCRADGTCAPVDDVDAAPGVDASGPAIDGAPAGCVPDHDGVVSRDEVLLAAGRSATFRVAVDVAVSTAGTLQPDGSRVWDLSGPLAGDADVDVELSPMTGAWYAGAFAGASYATRLSATEDLLGVFELTDTALLLRGVVSPAGGPTRTELTYDPPVVALSFPLATTSQWTSDVAVTGVAAGVPSIYSEAYESRVDAVGELSTPFGVFPVIRVRVDLTRTVGAVVVTVRSFAFVSECYGTVANVVSNEYELEPEFDQAAEVRRLAP